MFPEFLLPETTVREAGAGRKSALANQQGETLILTLGITRIVEQESSTSPSGARRTGRIGAPGRWSRFRRSSTAARNQMSIDLSQHPEVKHLRAKWQVNRWGKGDPSRCLASTCSCRPGNARWRPPAPDNPALSCASLTARPPASARRFRAESLAACVRSTPRPTSRNIFLRASVVGFAANEYRDAALERYAPKAPVRRETEDHDLQDDVVYRVRLRMPFFRDLHLGFQDRVDGRSS